PINGITIPGIVVDFPTTGFVRHTLFPPSQHSGSCGSYAVAVNEPFAVAFHVRRRLLAGIGDNPHPGKRPRQPLLN
ncbi:hypothetical protein, partial [Klebsiella pneumoniae]|uniref:hypothetical protein n=1 Tax=Klebsiella pneumoniae TaxID=573 RepID=UPI001C70117E